jgi:ethanolamine utilization protein EutM
MPKALGLVETRGLVAAIEAADAMVKTSNVTLIGKEVTRPALVTIKIVGDVAAVKASVDAGAAAAKKVGELVSIHVIPQPDSQMISMLPEIEDDEVKKRRPPKSPEKSVAKQVETVESMDKEVKPSAEKKEEQKTEETEIRETKQVKTETPSIKKSPESEILYSDTSDHLERLRREALGIRSEKQEPKKEKRP